MSISKLRGQSTLGAHTKHTGNTPKAKAVAAAATTDTTAQQATDATAVISVTATVTTTTNTPKLLHVNAPSAGATNTQQPPPPAQSQHLPQTSLLKIEPFVPSLNARLRRPIGRSYSTLSTTCLKRISGSPILRNAGPLVSAALDGTLPLPKAVRAVGRLRRQPVAILTRQRSKSNSSSSASNRPATAAAFNGNHTPIGNMVASSTAASTNVNGALVTPLPNGLCSIMRLPQEREKLPDRINYDGRGLTAIPIFEQEPTLRLLSLQHNLINVFQIPRQVTPPSEPVDLAPTVGKTASNGNTKHDNSLCIGGRAQRANGRVLGGINATAAALSISHVSRISTGAHSPTPPPPPTPTRASAAAAALSMQSAAVNQLLQRNGATLQRHINFNAPQLPAATQQQQQSAAQYRFGMKRSKSFMSNYTRQLGHIKRQLQQSQLGTSETRMLTTLAGMQLKSFDSGASVLTTDSTASTLLTSELEEDVDQQQQQQQQQRLLEIKNKQLQPAYGNIFQNLVFLDLYDNQIERIANLDGLPQLTVLLLGKNRIGDIGGLYSLRRTLRVLDLHGNKISSIGNKINCLQQLKSLNLAGNQIRQINQNDFSGLSNLKELNLKRNRIKRINGFHHLAALERLWLCHNELHKVDDMSSIAKALNLLEVTIENNPMSLAGDCVSFLVSYLPRLQSLSQMSITEQVRRAAMAWRKQKEQSEASYSQHSSDISNSMRREEVISNARTNWELLRSQQTVQAALGRHQRGSLKPPRLELKKINESNEALLVHEELEECIKLPPIQQTQEQPQPPQERTMEQIQKPQNDIPLAAATTADSIAKDKNMELSPSRAHLCGSGGSSGSSLGPNVDSSSSSYSSDNEQSSPQQLTLQRARIKKAHIRNAAATTGAAAAAAGATVHGGETALHSTNNVAANKHDRAAADIGQELPTVATTTTTLAQAAASTSASNSNTASVATAGDMSQQLTLMNCNQADNNSSTSCRSANSHDAAHMTMRLLQAATTPAMTLTTRGTVATTAAITLPAAAAASTRLCSNPQQQQQHTTTIAIIAGSSNGSSSLNATSSSTVCLGFRGHSATVPLTTGIKAVATTTTTGGGVAAATTLTTTTTCKRYMPSSLMRSQTIAGHSGNSGSGSGVVAGGGASGASNGMASVASKQAYFCHNNNNNNNSSNTLKTNVSGLLLQPQQQTATNMANGSAVAATTYNSSNKTTPMTITSATQSSISTISNNLLQVAALQQKTAAASNEREREREREQGGDYLIEICGRYLNVYGQGALRFIDKQWNPAKANDVHTLNFSYINFNNIAALLSRVKARFPHAEHFVFRETNISCLGQLNALAELQGIASLCIDAEGNAITTKDLWRQYAIYRLSHWGLRMLNGAEVSDAEVQQANCLYAGLSELVLWSMPDTMLQPLLARLRLDETCTASRLSPKEWLMRADAALRLVVGKEALQWKKLPVAQQQQQQQQSTMHYYAWEAVAGSGSGAAALSIRERGKIHFALMLENTCNAVEKLHKLQTLWPSLLLDIVRNTLLDYSQLDAYLRNLMSDIMK